MQARYLVVAAGVAMCRGCGPVGSATEVHSRYPAVLPAHFPSQVQLKLGLEAGAPETAGLTLWAANGTQVASSDCALVSGGCELGAKCPRTVNCPTPPLDVGTYSLRFSVDRSCGPKGYVPLVGGIDAVEPSHVVALEPRQGPAKAETSVKLTGSNIGKPYTTCVLTFLPAPGAATDARGAKLGCAKPMSIHGAEQVTPTSAVCKIPAWPGPMMQCGARGCHPLPGAECGREVQVQLTETQDVYSPEPFVFHYEEDVVVVV